jgi:7-cyano-7-deazaguanine synthase
MKRDGVVLLSGGLDSVVLTYLLGSQGHNLRALHFDVGRYARHRELHAAKRIASLLDIPIEVVDMQGIQRMVSGFLDPEIAFADDYDERCPFELTPALFSLGAAYTQLTGAKALYVAILREQVTARPNTERSLALIAEAAALYDPQHPQVEIQAPFLGHSKADIVTQGKQLDVPMQESWSCQYAGPFHCGRCPRCSERIKAFQTAGVQDQSKYQTGKD